MKILKESYYVGYYLDFTFKYFLKDAAVIKILPK